MKTLTGMKSYNYASPVEEEFISVRNCQDEGILSPNIIQGTSEVNL